MGSWARFTKKMMIVLLMKVSMVCFEPWALEIAGSNPADPTDMFVIIMHYNLPDSYNYGN